MRCVCICSRHPLLSECSCLMHHLAGTIVDSRHALWLFPAVSEATLQTVLWLQVNCIEMHNSWLPDSVYGTAALACLSQPCQAQNVPSSRSAFMMAAPNESKQQKIPLYSAKYYQACTIGGILACGNPPSTASHCTFNRAMQSECSPPDATSCLKRRTHAHQRHALGRRKMQYANRQQAI